MKRLLALLLLCCALPAAAAALPQKVTAIEGVTEYRLANGLRVLLLPDASSDTVTVHITYLVGSRHEGYGEKGMAHLLEHLLFKGSRRFPDLKRELTRRGARWNGTTSQDRTNYFETLSATPENLDWALAMEADRMVHSFIRKSDLDSEMSVVRNEFEMGENSAGGVLYQRMQRLAFSWHNYGNPIIGARSDIEAVPIGRLQAFYRTWYQPDNALLIIGGRFDAQRALALVARHFGPIPRPARTLPALYTSEPVQDGERSVTLRRAGDTPLVAAMYRVPAGSHPDYPAVDVLVEALRAAPQGRLHQALVQKGLASAAWASERALHDPGVVVFGASLPKDGALEVARDALLATLDGVRSEPMRDDEIERARTSLLNDMEKAQLDGRTLVSTLAEFAAVGDWRLFYLYRDRLRAVTLADVRRVADTYLKPANRVLGQFVPTTQPDRAQIPASPDLKAALAGYQGSASVAAGEAFDPSPANIEARLQRRTLANGIRAALLPKRTRGAKVVAQIGLHWGDEQSTAGRSTACSLAGGMLSRGTQQRTRAELRDAFDRLKATVSISAGGATIETQREHLAETLRLVAEALRHPSFPESEFEELKRASLSGAETRRSDPAAIATEQLQRHLQPYPKGHWMYVESLDERIEALKSVGLAGTTLTPGVAQAIGVTGGTVNITAGGVISFTPNLNFNGTVTFPYVITDGALTSTANQVITVTPVNDAPVAVQNNYTMAEDGAAITLTPLAGDSDPDGTTPTIQSINGTTLTPGVAQAIGVTGGTVNITAGGVISFTPNLNFNGTVTFPYVITDGALTSTANQVITVTPVNDAPVAVQNNYTMAEDGAAITLTPLAGDSDPDGTTPTIQSINGTTLTPGVAQAIGVTGGTVNITAGGVISFTPNLNFNGTVTFPYVITDGALTSTANQVITVTPVNDAPVDGNEANTVTEDVTLTVVDGAVGDLLNNATDIDGGALTISAFTVAGQAGPFVVGTGYAIAGVGTITINANGSYSFVPALNYAGAIPVITYTVSDGAGGTDTSTLTLSITAVNDAPVGVADNYTAVEGTTTVKTTVLANDTDPESNAITVTQFATNTAGLNAITANGTNTITTALGGTVVMNTDGTYTYTAPARNHGDVTPDIDSFAYRPTDGTTPATGWTTVNINITDTNPLANNDVDSVGFGSTVTGNVITGAGGITADTLNVDGPHTITSVVFNSTTYAISGSTVINTANGTLTIQPDGSYSYTLSTPAAIAVTAPTAVTSFTGAGFNVFGFDSTSAYVTAGNPNSGLNTATLNGTSAARVQFNTGGIGLDDGVNNANNSRIEEGEELVIALPATTKSATITVSDLGANEAALWETYNASGVLISSGTWPGNGVQSFTITTGTAFSYVVVRSSSVGGSSDEFRVTGISIQPEPSTTPDVFTYTLTDSDGDNSNATLTMGYDSSTTALNDVATVFEAGINANGTQNGGTQEAQTIERATGNILGNDTGVSSFSNLTVSGGTITGGTVTASAPDGNGVVTVTVTDTTAAARIIATITVYTQDFGGNVKGDYAVNLVGRTTDGAGTNDSFTVNYTLTNSVSGEVDNASLTVDVVDDVPTVQDAIVQVQQGVLPKQNLVFVIDSSGSMAGEVKSVAADGTVTIMNRLQATQLAVAAVINEYFSQGGNISITLIDFDSTSTPRGTYTTAASAIAALNNPANFTVLGGTNYDDALRDTMTAIGTPVVGESYTVYFISDGVPTTDNEPSTTDPIAMADPAGYTGYRAFVNANGIKSYAIGIASDISDPTELNNIHNVDSDISGVKDAAIIVTNVATLDDVLLASVPTSFGGSVAGSAANSSLNFGADGGYISSLIMRLDTNGDNVSDADVTFNFNPTTGQISVVGGGTPQTGFPITSDTLTLNDARGFEDGILVFNFRTGEYVYQTAGFASEGEQFDIRFVATDGDGDTASGKQTIQIVDGKPDANNDIDTLMGNSTFFEGNVISAIGTDGGDSVALTSFSTNRSGEDNPGDNGGVSSIVFKGVTFNLTALVVSTPALGGNYTVTNVGGVKTLTWTATTGGSSLVFNEEGYYKYTPPTAEIVNNVTGTSTNYTLTSAALVTTAATAGMTLAGIARASATEGSAAINTPNADGVGVVGNTAARIDNLESLVINFDTSVHRHGVQGVTITVDASNSNLGGTNAFNYSVYNVHGELIAQFARNTLTVAIPTNLTGIGKIVVDSGGTGSYAGSFGSVSAVTYSSILDTVVAAAPAPEVITYTITDTDGDTSSATLTLNNIIDDIAGTAANNTINGTARNENISGLTGDDTINAGAGFDIVRGGDGNDIIDGGADDDQLYGNAGNDTISGGTGKDQIYGDAGNDTLNGNDGDDYISGGDGSDVINGGIGADIILGGAGNDTLTGGAGVDVFRWEFADRGTTSSPATDVITDFDPAAVGGDVLDIRDMLTGEQHVTGTGNLTSYLHFEVVGANTIVHISNNGGFSNGFSPTKDVQRITLTGVDLVTGFADDNAIIQNLLTNNKLITD